MPIEVRKNRKGYFYFLLDGKRLPSPSSIANRYKESGGLMYWANQEGLAGRTLDEARDVAVAPGTIVHERIEAEIRGHEWDGEKARARILADGLDVEATWHRIENAWGSFQDWRRMTKLEPVAAEISLASEAHEFGGTLDAVAVDSRLHLLDWKSGALYPDHVIQLAGYVILWEENMPDQPLDGVGLISISKEHGTTTWWSCPRPMMDEPVEQFIALRQCFERDKRLKKLLG